MKFHDSARSRRGFGEVSGYFSRGIFHGEVSEYFSRGIFHGEVSLRFRGILHGAFFRARLR